MSETPNEVPEEQEFREWDEEQVISYFNHFPWFREDTPAVIREHCLNGSALLGIEQTVLSAIIPVGIAVNLSQEIQEIRLNGAYVW
jgi:hypothetical protein